MGIPLVFASYIKAYFAEQWIMPCLFCHHSVTELPSIIIGVVIAVIKYKIPYIYFKLMEMVHWLSMVLTFKKNTDIYSDLTH